MVIKSLTITESAYDALKRMKHADESFSEVVLRVASDKSAHIDKYFGILGGGEAKAEPLLALMKKRRKEMNDDFKKRASRW